MTYLESERWKRRRAVMLANAQARAGRSPQEQLRELDRRLGVNVGAEKERRKLREQLNARRQGRGKEVPAC
jgi:hypothetical protein